MQIRTDLIELIRLCRLVSKAMPRRPEDAKLAQTFGVMDLSVKKEKITPVTWPFPSSYWFVINLDGAAIGTPGQAGTDFAIRNSPG